MRWFLLLALACCTRAEAANYYNQGRYTASKTGNQSFTTQTLADVTDMSFTVVAGVTYRYQFEIIFQSTSASVGIGLSLSIPTSSRFGAMAMIPQSSDGPGALYNGAISASDDVVVTPQVEAANVDYMARIVGLITPTVSGTLKLRARNETGATAVLIKQGSFATMEAYP